jgi:hypothetical protein
VLFLDIGLPMIAVYWPPAWLAFVPIVLIEALVGFRTLAVRSGRVVIASAIANLFSTLLGIPMTWFVLALIELLGFGSALGFETPLQKVYSVTVQSPWLMPYAERSRWMVPVAASVLSIPMYAMSVLSEYVIARRFFPTVARRLIWRWQLKGNALSYIFLVCVIVGVIFFGDHFGWLYKPFQGIINFFIELIFRIADALTGRTAR